MYLRPPLTWRGSTQITGKLTRHKDVNENLEQERRVGGKYHPEAETVPQSNIRAPQHLTVIIRAVQAQDNE